MGVDDVTWGAYEAEHLGGRLADLHARVLRGAYCALPSRRKMIPKPDGRERPLGIASLEDKSVQRAMVEILNEIYEADLLGFSYGFRPGRGQHDTPSALAPKSQRVHDLASHNGHNGHNGHNENVVANGAHNPFLPTRPIWRQPLCLRA
jgi:hypothetical protein